MKPNKPTPIEEWLRLATEARPQLPPPPPDEPAPAWFVERTLAERRAARRRSASGPWFAFPGLARAATASVVLAVACAVFVFSTGALEAFEDPLFPELEMDYPDLP